MKGDNDGPATTPDGYTVDENGAWTVNGVVQTGKQKKWIQSNRK